MAGEFQLHNPTLHGRTVYAILFSQSGLVWNTSSKAFEAWADAHYSNYVIAMSEQGSSGFFLGSMPSGIAAGILTFAVYTQAGASAALGDPVDVQQQIQWNGVGPVTIASLNWQAPPNYATLASLCAN